MLRNISKHVFNFSFRVLSEGEFFFAISGRLATFQVQDHEVPHRKKHLLIVL